ncbi:hypothetical protein Goshw_024663 [Gossypium schwendimanii]|uniref:Uncharacterized protein n=1 Tax=Gossypium schwendimanii TaxID=34291 RepID=A0A7J9LBX2_GOSSC|nr:hypothetical protein [Gossypium schwendimanii]
MRQHLWKLTGRRLLMRQHLLNLKF